MQVPTTSNLHNSLKQLPTGLLGFRDPRAFSSGGLQAPGLKERPPGNITAENKVADFGQWAWGHLLGLHHAAYNKVPRGSPQKSLCCLPHTQPQVGLVIRSKRAFPLPVLLTWKTHRPPGCQSLLCLPHHSPRSPRPVQSFASQVLSNATPAGLLLSLSP